MIVKERIEIDGSVFIHTFSDAGRYVLGGEPYGEYEETYDPAEFERTYVEGDLIPPDESEEDETAAKAEAYDILMGVSE